MLKTIWADLGAVFGFFTRIPVASGDNTRTLAEAAWAFPVVGTVVGAAAGCVFAGAAALGFSPVIAAWVAIASQVFLTRGLHEDGLSDLTDGLGGGRDKESRLAIMRDSRIGSFGAIALIIALSLRADTLATLATPRIVFVALVIAGMFSRTAIAVLMEKFPLARSDGMAVHASTPTHKNVGIAIAITLITTLLLLPFFTTLVALIAATVVTQLLGYVARTRIGGITGDVCGATQQLVEIAVLLTLSRSFDLVLH